MTAGPVMTVTLFEPGLLSEPHRGQHAGPTFDPSPWREVSGPHPWSSARRGPRGRINYIGDVRWVSGGGHCGGSPASKERSAFQ